MIPSGDVDTTVALDVARLAAINAETVLVNPWCIHDYEPGLYASVSWQDAETESATERALLAEADVGATTVDDFYELAFDLGRGRRCLS